MTQPAPGFWGIAVDELLRQLETSPRGLTAAEARERLRRFESDRLRSQRRTSMSLLLTQFKSPIVLLLMGSAVLSFLLDDQTNAIIILLIVVASGLLGWWQERSAADAVARLLEVIETRATVRREGRETEIPVNTIVPGDIVLLNAGDLIPGDCRILDSKDLLIDEATLTGESFPVEKVAGDLPADLPLNRRTSALFLGTHVVSGAATVVVVQIGKSTEFGRVSARLAVTPPDTAFERGIRNFGNLLIKITVIFVIAVFAINIALERPVVESLLFALALAVGMTPQLLPAITSVVLADGAKSMAAAQVIVKQLLSIENFGSMNVLCADKTGTLTEGVVRLQSAQDVGGHDCPQVLHYARLNAQYQTGFTNPIDSALLASGTLDLNGAGRLDEIPYDFSRKRLSILIAEQGLALMITKGALTKVLEACSQVELPGGEIVAIELQRAEIARRFAELSEQGFRVLGLAYRRVDLVKISKSDERELTFLGFLVFFDPPKSGIVQTLHELAELGVRLKIITGDNRVVAAAISRQVGLGASRVLTGPEIQALDDADLAHQATHIDLFAEVEPNQKERIILALRKAGHVVGYLGDGINDASALHAADVGISVAQAVDVAREAAKVVLLRQDLSVLVQGVREGRRTLANTLKYVFVSISANFGYMFSMAVASLFLPFLPLLPSQILLINLLADFPAMMLATDSVDPELIDRPRRWNIGFIGRFMLVFGWSSSLFDFLTFGVLLSLYHADIDHFRTGFFIESVVTGLLMMLIVRTQRPFFKSRPSFYLLVTALVIAVITVALPCSPISSDLGFARPPWSLLALVVVIAALYALTMELAKWIFYRHTAA